MRLLICAGGTGGGVNPALAVLQSLAKGASDVLWVGGEGGMEADLVARSGVPFAAIPAAGVHGVGARALPGKLARLARGVAASRRILRQFNPDVMLFTGGYVAVPMAVAGVRVPSLLYVPDIEPGLALKVLARFADRICLTTEDSRRFFTNPKKWAITGYPVRDELKRWAAPEMRAQARRQLGLRDDLPVLLVQGGSKGARSINRALMAILPGLLANTQVLHASGAQDWDEVSANRDRLDPALAANYHAYPYLHDEMGPALAAADLAVSRAGASTLGEYPLFGLPALLVPYPYAWRYQKVNAGFLVERGAALQLEDARLGDDLRGTLSALLADRARLDAMRAAMTVLARPQAAQSIAAELTQLAERRKQAV